MSKQDTAQQLRKVANFLKGLVQAADDIEAIGSMEGATAEALAARDKAVAGRDEAIKMHTDIQAKCKALVAETRGVADKMLADAERDATALAADLLAKADAAATKLTQEATKQAVDTLASANDAVAKAATELTSLKAQSAALTAEVADLEAKAKAAQAEHDKLTKALDRLKAQFKIGE